jgi:hypothetical protein
MSVVLLEATTSGVTAKTLLSADSTSSFDMYYARAVSADGTVVLIEEARSTDVDPYISVGSRYWLQVASGTKTPVTTYGGLGIYAEAIDSYLFACSPTGSGCKEKTFCVVKKEEKPDSQSCVEKSVSFDYGFRSFPQTLPAAP